MLPKDLNWFHFHLLNPYFNIPNSEEGVLQYLKDNPKALQYLPYNLDHIKAFVFTPGKTGTVSLTYSLRKALGQNGNQQVFMYHTSTLFPKPFTLEQLLSHNQTKLQDVPRLSPSSNLSTSRSRLDLLQVFSTYRDPIDRIISNFFEITKDKSLITIPNLLRYIRSTYKVSYPFVELSQVSSLNIFDKPFNKQKGYQTFSADRFNLMLLRFDHINSFQDIIRQIIPNYIHIHANRNVKRLYITIKNSVVIPKELLDSVYDYEDKNLRYFFTDLEIAKMKSKYYDRLIEKK